MNLQNNIKVYIDTYTHLHFSSLWTKKIQIGSKNCFMSEQ